VNGLLNSQKLPPLDETPFGQNRMSPEGVCTDELLARKPGFLLLQLCTVAHFASYCRSLGFLVPWSSSLTAESDLADFVCYVRTVWILCYVLYGSKGAAGTECDVPARGPNGCIIWRYRDTSVRDPSYMSHIIQGTQCSSRVRKRERTSKKNIRAHRRGTDLF
jgi:hypothetical protein